jgi:hypothetical protein
VSTARIYANPWLARRANGSLVVIAIAFVLGAVELWFAARAGPEGTGNGFLFAALFVGGGAYGLRQVLGANRDAVISLDLDGDIATVAMWKPFGARRIVGPVAQLTEWRPYAKPVRRNLNQPMLLADHPEHPRPLEFELGQGILIGEALRKLAGEALGQGQR